MAYHTIRSLVMDYFHAFGESEKVEVREGRPRDGGYNRYHVGGGYSLPLLNHAWASHSSRESMFAINESEKGRVRDNKSRDERRGVKKRCN